MTEVWIVENTDYDSEGSVAAFITRELAEQHADERGNSYGIAGYDILDHLPKLLKVEDRRARVYNDGRVEHLGTGQREEWDYLLGPRADIQRTANCADISVWNEGGLAGAVLLAQITWVLLAFADEKQWTPEQLQQALAGASDRARPPRPVSHCYDASFGRVHYKANCRC